MYNLEVVKDLVNKKQPKAIIVLDTNVLLNEPDINSYLAGADFACLFLIPGVVDGEVMGLGNASDKETRAKAIKAKNTLDQLYRQGNPKIGIPLQNGHLWATVTSRTSKDDNEPYENVQIKKLLGTTDWLILELLKECQTELGESMVFLASDDNNLKHFGKSYGVGVVTYSTLLSTDAFLEAIIDHRKHTIPEITVDSLLTSVQLEEERTATVSLTLNELRSEGEFLVAKGKGYVREQNSRAVLPFLWEFPYKDARKVSDDEELYKLGNVFPDENLDFLGQEEQIPLTLRKRIAELLENAANLDMEGELQAATALGRWALVFHLGYAVNTVYSKKDDVETMVRSLIRSRIETSATPPLPEFSLERYLEAYRTYNQSMREMLDDPRTISAKTLESAYSHYRKLCQLDHPPFADDNVDSVEDILDWVLGRALSSWAVGETKSSEVTYQLYEFLEEQTAEESSASEGDEEDETNDSVDEGEEG